MKFFIGFEQIAKIQSGVFFGSSQIGMPQQLLDNPQIRSPLQQVRSKRMAEQMGIDMLA